VSGDGIRRRPLPDYGTAREGREGTEGPASAVPVDGQLCADAGLFLFPFLGSRSELYSGRYGCSSLFALKCVVGIPSSEGCGAASNACEGSRTHNSIVLPVYIRTFLLHPSMTYMQGNGAWTHCDASALIWKVECITLYSVEISHVISLGFSHDLFLLRCVRVPVINGPKETECVAK
jgi:hypothetical protein